MLIVKRTSIIVCKISVGWHGEGIGIQFMISERAVNIFTECILQMGVCCVSLSRYKL